MYKEITHCRICGNKNLISLLNLGEQTLTGVFPKSIDEKITSGPLELVKCEPSYNGEEVCHLVQLRHSYNNTEIYGLNYGYRSGLNGSMVKHLHDIVDGALSIVTLNGGEVIVDIGSNDSTLLQHYPTNKNIKLLGIDPTGIKYASYYPKHILLEPDFFSAAALQKKLPDAKAKIITSVAMFYDLEEPMTFVKEVFKSLADDGIWVFEQSYLPLMLESNAYDTICHEHLEYYGLRQIQWMMSRTGFKIIDVEENDTNGGSFKITAAKENSFYKVKDSVKRLAEKEAKLRLDTLAPYKAFQQNIIKHKDDLCKLIRELNSQGKKVFGYGASTKGNVLLQYCGIKANDMPYIAEVNEDKFGSFTPFTHIPIISEEEARKLKPDYFVVLPWHFRMGILEKEQDFISRGGKFIFPLPNIEIV